MSVHIPLSWYNTLLHIISSFNWYTWYNCKQLTKTFGSKCLAISIYQQLCIANKYNFSISDTVHSHAKCNWWPLHTIMRFGHQTLTLLCVMWLLHNNSNSINGIIRDWWAWLTILCVYMVRIDVSTYMQYIATNTYTCCTFYYNVL